MILPELLFQCKNNELKKLLNQHIDSSLSNSEEYGSFEDFSAFYLKMDNADLRLLPRSDIGRIFTTEPYLSPSSIP